MTHHSVYVFYRQGGDVLYVGCTSRLPERLDQHRVTKPWWKNVTTVTVEHFDNKQDALDRERDLIWTFLPEHNVQPHERPGMEAAKRMGLVRASTTRCRGDAA